MDFSINVKAWTAWSPFCQSKAEWTSWAQNSMKVEGEPRSPKVSFVPAMTRRRFSPLTKAMFVGAHSLQDWCSDLTPSVFCSRHGEQFISQSLLKSVANEEPLSPLKFSVSVHNAASGNYSIFSGNRAPSTAIAGGPASFMKGLVEAGLTVLDENTDNVLYIFGDEPPTELFQSVVTEPEYLFCIAMVLTRDSSAPSVKVSYTKTGSDCNYSGSVALDWLRDAFNVQKSQSFSAAGEHWKLETEPVEFLNCYHASSE